MSSCRRRESRSEGGFRISNFEFVGAREAGGLIGVCCPRLGGVNSEFGNRRRQRSELRPHPKEEAMSHALATVLRDGRRPSAIRNAAPPPGGIFSLWGPAATMPRGVLSFGLLAVSVSCGYYEESNWRDHAV